MSQAQIQRQAHQARGKLLPLGVWVVVLTLLLAPAVQTQAADDDVAALRSLSKGFTRVAKGALPAVVFIKVEKSETAGRGPSEFNNPFDFFGEEFFERFFGRRAPEGRQPEGRQPRQRRQMGQGSGFIISRDGYILTNHHVVGEADRVIVGLADGRELTAKTVGTDPKSDVAVIKIEGKDFPVLPLGDSDTLEVGEWVIALGNPFGLSQTLTVGVVSAKGRSGMGITDYEDFIQTDAAINPGNSGGPMINLQGAAVGVNTAIFSRSGGYMGIGFAIPINMVKGIEKQLVSSGKVVRGYLGINIQNLSEELAKSFGVESTSAGVLVASVVKNSPAAKAGLKAGDVMVEYEGKPVREPGQVRNSVAMTSPGTTVKMVVLRDKKRQELSIKIGELPAEQTASASGESEKLEKLGLSVQELTKDVAQQLGYEKGEGVVVAQVEPDSAASRAGIHRGMLIRQVNQKAVTTPQEFAEALTESDRTQRVLLLVQDRQSTRYIALRLG